MTNLEDGEDTVRGKGSIDGDLAGRKHEQGVRTRHGAPSHGVYGHTLTCLYNASAQLDLISPLSHLRTYRKPVVLLVLVCLLNVGCGEIAV